MSKGKDISTMFTREENKKNGRLGYGLATREKDTIISPARYGAFLQKRGKRK
jgi:predicted transcriptional regulator